MYALRIVGDADDAEDLVEDAFLKTWAAIRSRTDISNFNVYIYRAVRNECLMFLRQKREFVGIESIPEISDEVLDTSVRDAKIWRAIDKLPEKCREVFLLSKRDGLSNEEIAEELNISVQIVKNQISKAFNRLREVLASEHKPFFRLI